MVPDQLSADTSAVVEQRQIEAWRQMSPAPKAAIVTGLTQAVYDLAWAGVRCRHPDATPRSSGGDHRPPASKF